MAPYRIAIMNENIGTFGHDRIKQRTKKDKNHEKLQPHHKYKKIQAEHNTTITIPTQP